VITVSPSASTAQTHARRLAGLTLVEMMVSTGIFSLAVLGLVYTQMFGMRQDQLVNSKSGACEQARVSFNDLTTDIRSAKLWQIGNGNLSAFTPIPNGTSQQGNALQLSLTTDTNQFILYFFDTNSCQLRRGHSGSTAYKTIVQYLTNTMYFRAETPHGDIQTDLSHKGVINVVLQLAQYQYPLTRIGPGYYYNFYEMQFRITPHIPDGI
jgi:Tfp pilus assembly protein PilW